METIINRPYVYLFLLAYLIISGKLRGMKSTLLFLVSGYIIALISEASSIRTGFPYGWYFYIYDNMPGELMVAGVPFWDSLSYPFLCFSGWIIASIVDSKNPYSLYTQKDKNNVNLPSSFSQMIKMTLWGALFTTLLDVIIDPVAHLGEKWFLGKIYYYPNPGYYFDIPISNFLGWFFVSSLIIGINLKFFSGSLKSSKKIWFFCGVGLYFGIFLFNWGIAIYLREWWLVLCDLIIISIPIFWIYQSMKNKSKIRLN